MLVGNFKCYNYDTALRIYCLKCSLWMDGGGGGVGGGVGGT